MLRSGVQVLKNVNNINNSQLEMLHIYTYRYQLNMTENILKENHNDNTIHIRFMVINDEFLSCIHTSILSTLPTSSHSVNHPSSFISLEL